MLHKNNSMKEIKDIEMYDNRIFRKTYILCNKNFKFMNTPSAPYI